MNSKRQLNASAQWGNTVVGDGLKRCRVCGEVKPFKQFYSDPSNKSSGVRATCSKCTCDRRRDRVRAYVARNKEKLNRYSREWQREHHTENREVKRLRSAARYAANPHTYVEANARKRALCRDATPAWSIRFFVREAYHLARLRSKITGIDWQVDHIVPLKSKLVCGLHAHTNVQVIPTVQNRTKHNTVWPDMP